MNYSSLPESAQVRTDNGRFVENVHFEVWFIANANVINVAKLKAAKKSNGSSRREVDEVLGRTSPN